VAIIRDKVSKFLRLSIGGEGKHVLKTAWVGDVLHPQCQRRSPATWPWIQPSVAAWQKSFQDGGIIVKTARCRWYTCRMTASLMTFS